MLEKTVEFIGQNKLFTESDSLLLTVSGGIDSMVMLDIFTRLPYSFSVAHCNFSLRGKESDGDQELVESYCSERGISLYIRRFETLKYADENGLSIQMAARELRYRWFEELRAEYKLDVVLLAHNKDDVIETFLINLSRGTGILGLTGIKARNNNIARPLLFASRDDIIIYADKHGLRFREDSSNAETKYRRNAIRHRVIPVFKELNPSFLESMEGTIKRLRETDELLSRTINSTRKVILIPYENGLMADTKILSELEPLDTWLYEIFKEYGIGQANIEELKKLLDAPSGKYLETGSHRFSKDRGKLLITVKKDINIKETSYNNFEEIPGYTVEIIPADEVKISKEPGMAYLDYDKIKLPVTIRSWKEGDWFHPFGMKGKKKLSDFFVDQKIPRNRKDTIRLLISDGNIIWVAGLRIDMRYAVSKSTRRVLVICPED